MALIVEFSSKEKKKQKVFCQKKKQLSFKKLKKLKYFYISNYFNFS
jgi:hypothetical protein